MAASPPPSKATLARQVREHFVTQMEEVLGPLGDAIRNRLIELVDSAVTTREAQERRDAMLDFDRQRKAWRENTANAWRRALAPPSATTRVRLDNLNLELIGDEVVENKILSSRLALAVQEKANWELNDLKTRMQHLEAEELGSQDVLRPESLPQLMVEQWSASGLGRPMWQLVHDLIQKNTVERMVAAYKSTNEFLVKQGVLPDIELAGRVKRAAAPPRRSPPAPAAGADSVPGDAGAATTGAGPATDPGAGYGGGWSASGSSTSGGPGAPSGGSGDSGGWQGGAVGSAAAGAPGFGTPGFGAAGFGRAGGAGAAAGPGGAAYGTPAGPGGVGGGAAGAGAYGGGQGGGAAGAGGGYAPPGMGAGGGAPASAGFAGGHGGVPPGAAAPGQNEAAFRAAGGVADETRMMTSTTPLARARMRATGVIGQLKRLLTEKAGVDMAHGVSPSPALAEAIGRQVQTQVHSTVQRGVGDTEHEVVVYDDAAVERAAVDLRERTGELKKKAATTSEKATIEIVALMFQAILAEERIPPGVRVWFARLQMPVLRVALAEPEFFGTLQHPARQLIDRMGSCVLGFSAAAISGSALEAEIKRVVQMIEQYPETGRRVFQLVYEEFQKFLSRYLTEKSDTQKVVSVAQQVEQKETLAIQYTIELRKMLNDVPVRDEIRGFLFKVWAEVLAVAAVKHGPQHTETVLLKKSAADLVWSASAKPNRAERAKVIQDLPALLQRLRKGMTLLGLPAAEQEKHIKAIGDTLADAFMSKTESIPQAQIDAMTKRLANLEDFISDDPSADLPLDQEAIEMMLGIDASMIEVVADGGSKPTDAMLAWASELQQGAWFTLDHNGKLHQVQYVWKSERGQLHLFASADGRSFLVQARRLASYLQAGLLLPAEEEALTVRATRDALAKLDANPERLLAA